jgi:S-formylglutathione hydrolase FrmB
MRPTLHDPGLPAGTFETWETLDLGGSPRTVHVLRPRSVPESGGLPALYLFDGDVAFFPGGPAGKTWDVAGTLHRLREKLPPILVIAVVPRERDHEYTHVDWREGRRPWGGLPDYAEWLATRLKPFIDDEYPTDPRPEASAIAGSSHGGLAAFWTGAVWPSAFGVIGALSPSFFSGLDSLNAPAGVVRPGPSPLRESPLWAATAPALSDPYLRPRIFLSWGLRRHGGDHDRVVEALATERGREMVDLLLTEAGYTQGFDLQVHQDPVGGHDEDAWRWQLGEMLAWWAQPRNPAP